MNRCPNLAMRLALPGLALLLAIHLATPLHAGIGGQDEEFDFHETQIGIDFPGGSVEEFVDHLKARVQAAGFNGPLNLVITDGAGEFRLPTIEVTTSIEGALACLAACSNDYQELFVDWDETQTVRFIRLADSNPPIVQVMNVKHIVTNVKQEDFVSAIQIGLEMASSSGAGTARGEPLGFSEAGAGGGGAPSEGGGRVTRSRRVDTGSRTGPSDVSMKLHEETGLFFVKGPRERIQIIEQIVSQLSPNAGIYNYQNYRQQPTVPNSSSYPNQTPYYPGDQLPPVQESGPDSGLLPGPTDPGLYETVPEPESPMQPESTLPGPGR